MLMTGLCRGWFKTTDVSVRRWSTSGTTIAVIPMLLAPGVTTLEQQDFFCADGTAPDVTTGLCADGSQPQSQSFNATAPGVTTPEQQLICADGTAPDVTTGLCADGSQPQSQSFNATLLVLPHLNSNLSALTVLHLMSLPVSVLMVHNHSLQLPDNII